MKRTKIWTIPPEGGQWDAAAHEAVREAAELLRGGGTVAFPTETVYGLGADARNTEAVDRVFEAKGRPSDNPLIVHIAELGQLEELVLPFGEAEARLMERFWPGPLTLVLPVRPGAVSPRVTAGLDTVAVRMPANEAALRLIAAAGCPVAAPSANRSGRPSPTRAAHVADDLDGLIDGLVDGGPTGVGLESTVVELVYAGAQPAQAAEGSENAAGGRRTGTAAEADARPAQAVEGSSAPAGDGRAQAAEGSSALPGDGRARAAEGSSASTGDGRAQAAEGSNDPPDDGHAQAAEGSSALPGDGHAQAAEGSSAPAGDGRARAALEIGSAAASGDAAAAARSMTARDAAAVRILRPGGITPEALRTVIADVIVDDSLAAAIARPLAGAAAAGADAGQAPRSPGMKYAHYAPRGEMTLVTGDPAAVQARIRAETAAARARGLRTGVLTFAEHRDAYTGEADIVIAAGSLARPGEAAQELYAALRAFDAAGAQAIWAEGCPETGIGLAVMNRLRKAAGGRTIDADLPENAETGP